MALDIPARIRDAWTPERSSVLVGRSADVAWMVAALRTFGWPIESDEQLRRDAGRLLFARWMRNTGRLSDRYRL